MRSRRFWAARAGFTYTEMIGVVAVAATLAGVAVPLLQNTLAAIRLSESARAVERELQTARLMAVSFNRPLRVRINCPTTGDFRMVELIGTPAFPAAQDLAANRCSPTVYPHPAGDRNALTRPNHDGPVRRLRDGVTFSAGETIEFWPDGSAHANSTGANPWPTIGGSVTIRVSEGSRFRNVAVNGLGRIQLVP
jgi:type II secretory pathway pseudopilin PulG